MARFRLRVPVRFARRVGTLSLVALLAACNTAQLPTSSTSQPTTSSLAITSQAVTTVPAQDEGSLQLPSSLTAAFVGQIKQAQMNLVAQALPLRLVKYSFGTGLETAAQVSAVSNRLVADQVVVPQYDGAHPESFTLSTVQERMKAFQADQLGNQDVVSNIRSMVFPLLNVGQRTVQLTWESQGRQFQTTGVYDTGGLVYDSILSNLVLVQNDLPVPLQTTGVSSLGVGSDAAGSDVKPMSSRAQTARVLSLTLKWVWGSTRGKITVDHTVIINGSKFIDQSGSAHYYMDLGSADAKTRNTVLKPTQLAKLAYGYAWATPTASFSISFDAKKGDVGGSFSVSLSGVGSKGGGDAHHTFYF